MKEKLKFKTFFVITFLWIFPFSIYSQNNNKEIFSVNSLFDFIKDSGETEMRMKNDRQLAESLEKLGAKSFSQPWKKVAFQGYDEEEGEEIYETIDAAKVSFMLEDAEVIYIYCGPEDYEPAELSILFSTPEAENKFISNSVKQGFEKSEFDGYVNYIWTEGFGYTINVEGLTLRFFIQAG